MSSVAAILLAGSIMAGGTYALFTSESKTNIAVSSGKVEVTANIDESSLKTFSGVDLTGNADTDTISETAEAGKFTNGGSAEIKEDGTLELTNVTPGDKVTFTIKVKNESNVAIKYRTVLTAEADTGLFNGLEFDIGDEQFAGLTSKSKWKELDASGKISSESEDGTLSVECSVNLPSSANDEYQNKSCTVSYIVEAVQGNAKTEDLAANTYEIYNASDLKWFQKNANNVKKVDGILATVKLMKDIDLGNKEWTPINWNYNADGEGGTFDGNGHTIYNFKVFENSDIDPDTSTYKKDLGLFGKVKNKTIKNLTIKNATVSGLGRVGAIVGQGICAYIENCHVYDSTFTSSTVYNGTKYEEGDKAGAIVGQLNAEGSAHVSDSSATNCKIKGYRDIGGLVGYFGCYATSTNENAYVTNNSVTNITITNDRSYDYKEYGTGTGYDVGEVVGEQYIPEGCEVAPSLVDDNTIGEDVTITVE